MLWAWGLNQNGQLGEGTYTSSRLSPVSVVGGFTDWCQVSAGAYHVLAVRQNGTAWAWGFRDCRLGDGSSFGGTQTFPVPVIGGFTDWCQVSGGGNQSLGIRSLKKGF